MKKNRRSSGMGRNETIEVRNNLTITARERGKIVARREGHNIWLNIGRQYLASLISCTSFDPDTYERSDRIKYMGLGIGGTRQLSSNAAIAPWNTIYPGTNTQTDIDPTVSRLERPIRVSSTASSIQPYPGLSGDVWLAEVQTPIVHSTSTESTFTHIFATTDINIGPFSSASMPLSEVMLFTSGADPAVCPTIGSALYNVAYDTFDSISKTLAFDLEIDWTVRF